MTQLSREAIIAKANDVVAREAGAVADLQQQLGRTVVDVARVIFECRGHVLVAGAGTSRAIAQRFAHLLACCGTASRNTFVMLSTVHTSPAEQAGTHKPMASTAEAALGAENTV